MTKVPLFTYADKYLIYSDYTYSRPHWEDGRFSEWKVADGYWYFRHYENTFWSRDYKEVVDAKHFMQLFEEAISKSLEKAIFDNELEQGTIQEQA